MLTQPETRDPERDFAQPEEKAVAAAVTLTASVSSNRQIVIQTYVERDAELSTYHEVLDKMSQAITRQEARLQIEDHEANLALEEKTLRQLKEDFGLIEERSRTLHEASGKKGPWRPTPQENAQKTNALTNVKRYEDAIVKRKNDIAKLRALIAEG